MSDNHLNKRAFADNVCAAGGHARAAPTEVSRTAPEKRAYRIDEAAAAYSISRSSLYVLIADGKLPDVKVGGRRLIPRDALEALIASNS
jgi:excisionase family DNA binding protein